MKLFSRASDDVKLSLLLDSLPKLNVKKILADMSESEKEVKPTQTNNILRTQLRSFVYVYIHNFIEYQHCLDNI